MADEAEEKPLAECPDCGCTHAPEISSKTVTLGKIVKLRSRRQCRHCGRVFTVTEDVLIAES